MADFVDSTVKEIDSRLKELESEVSKLKAARTALVGERRPAARPAAPAARTRRARATPRARRAAAPRARRSGGGTRANQALELVRNRPGITIPQIAQELGIEPNYLYRVMPKLVENGQVTREGQGWHPAKAAD